LLLVKPSWKGNHTKVRYTWPPAQGSTRNK
jgi:hypothetical protein